MSNHTSSSDQASKRSSRATPQSRRSWTLEEERTLIDGLKDLCVKGWKADNGTFRPGYMTELELYLNKIHPNCGLKTQPHINSKMKIWKKDYGTIALLKSRSGLGFHYGEGRIIVDDPSKWDEFVKADPNAKGMQNKTWPLFEDWEEIFGKDRATGEFAEGPEDAFEEIVRSQGQGVSNDRRLGFLIEVDDEDDEEDARHEPDVAPGEDENAYRPSRASQSADRASESVNTEHQQNQQQGKNTRSSSSNVNDKERSKKRKRTVEDVNETALRDLVDVMKEFTANHSKTMGALIDMYGARDESEIRGKVLDILSSPTYQELYSPDQQIKASMGLTSDVRKMDLFLRMGELQRQNIVWMIVNDMFPST
ncbi:uncharacterized protein LOC132599354 isoform X2 [Lycium barbarum]|uniref:uncharacterized protein LOC132599354 isoform X2 n=1 Tax=Lycium barbarum TaxID=112863 RepID=UPI00293E27E5|nr:uncharacterized protein LOC132599354 isoform X2 [Lycium barbarum]XP_060168668.1 uncharacterized protein LOC132599354 isoform X2 [Lycium barbarum]